MLKRSLSFAALFAIALTSLACGPASISLADHPEAEMTFRVIAFTGRDVDITYDRSSGTLAGSRVNDDFETLSLDDTELSAEDKTELDAAIDEITLERHDGVACALQNVGAVNADGDFPMLDFEGETWGSCERRINGANNLYFEVLPAVFDAQDPEVVDGAAE